MNLLRLSFVILILAICAGAQTSGSQPAADPTKSGAGELHKQSNANSATQDNSAISGDQVTKPAGAKTTTVIGCLGLPDADGKYMLNSMQYRSGVEVLGPNNLGTAAGQKVKLTGNWAPANPAANDGEKKQTRRFQATSFDVLAEKCPPPAETTPASKKKQKQQKAAAKAAQASNPQ